MIAAPSWRGASPTRSTTSSVSTASGLLDGLAGRNQKGAVVLFWRMVVASPRTRALVTGGWAFVWSLGYAATTLVPLGVHGFRWWVPIIGCALLIGIATAVLTVWTDRTVPGSYAPVLDGLTTAQRQQVSRVWRHGPVPTDPAVLTAALRLHAVFAQQRQGNRGRRITGAVLVGLATLMLATSAFSEAHQVSFSAVMFLLIGVFILTGPTATAIRAKRRQPRLAQLNAAAQSDPTVAAAVARPATPAAPVARGQRVRWAAAAITIAAICIGALEYAMTVSPHRAGCRAVDAVVKEIYQDRGYLLADDAVGPGGASVSQFQQWAESMRRHAAEADGDPTTTPHLDRIADLAAHAVTVVEQARQPGSPTPLADSQNTYLGILSQLIAEEGPAQDQCRR